jgi:hypothetical protein
MKKLLPLFLVSLFLSACFAPYTYEPIEYDYRPNIIEIDIVIGKTTKMQLKEMAGDPDYITIFSSSEDIYYRKRRGTLYNITIKMRDNTVFSKSYDEFNVSIVKGVITTFRGD